MEQADVRSSNVFDRFAVAGVLIAVAAIPLTRSLVLPVVGPRLTLFELIAFPTIAAWLIARTVSCTWRSVRLCPTLDVPLALFWMLAAVSGLSAYRDLGAPALIPFGIELTVLTYLLLLFLAARDLISRHQMFGAVLTAWASAVLLVGLVGAVGIGEMVRCTRPLSSLTYDGARLLATFRNPNQVAAYLVPSVVLFTALWASTRRLRWGHFAVAAALTGTCVLYFAASRGGDVAAIAGWIGILLLLPGRPAARVVAAMTALVFVLSGWALVMKSAGNACFLYVGNTVTTMTLQLPASLRQARELADSAVSQPDASVPLDERQPPDNLDHPSMMVLQHITPHGGQHHVVLVNETEGLELAGATTESGETIPQGSDTSTSLAFRRVMARIAWHYALAHPITGVGLGTMHLRVQQSTGRLANVDAHNMTMTVLAETGFAGAALFTWIIVWFLWSGAVAAYRAADPAVRALQASVLAALSAYLVMALSFDGQRQRVLWMLLAVLFAAIHCESAPHDAHSTDA
ncbi:MAG: O-antigen ligase family protein [Vicinamibacterales bacterium]